MKFIITINFCLSCFFLIAQEDRFIGLIDGILVEVNPFEPSVETIVDLNFDVDIKGTDMAYSVEDCLFYTIIDATNKPKLLSFDFLGNYNIIGEFSLFEGTIFVAEAIAYDEITGLMYISASLDAHDFYSESLLVVDVLNAECSLVTQLDFLNGRRADMDNMVIHEQTLYFNDGQPGDDDTDHYELS